MMESSLKHHFLVSMPGLADDPHFGRTVIYLCDHSADGALGLVINRPLDMSLSDLLARAGLEAAPRPALNAPVWHGGPVSEDRGFVLHRDPGEWRATLTVADDIRLTTSRDILAAIAADGLAGPCLVSIGYCGWTAGQLEQELARNSWLTVPADAEVLFDLPAAERLEAALRPLGLSYGRLGADAGHA